MRKKIVIGDVFCVKINTEEKKFFQYIANDLTQLNSNVIRAFKTIYKIDENPDLINIVSNEVDFHAHCTVRQGLKNGHWEFVGNIKELGDLNEILFRSTDEHGISGRCTSWWIWRINENAKYVGLLEEKYQHAEEGSAYPSGSILYRMKHGKYDFVDHEY